MLVTKTIQRDKMGTSKRIVHKSKIRTLYFSMQEPFQNGIYIFIDFFKHSPIRRVSPCAENTWRACAFSVRGEVLPVPVWLEIRFFFFTWLPPAGWGLIVHLASRRPCWYSWVFFIHLQTFLTRDWRQYNQLQLHVCCFKSSVPLIDKVIDLYRCWSQFVEGTLDRR